MDKLCGEDANTNFEDEVAVGPGTLSPRNDEGDDENEEMFGDFD